MDSTDLSESYDSVAIGFGRRIPAKLMNLSPDMDLNQVELEVIEEAKEFPDRPPPNPSQSERKKTVKRTVSTKTKVRLFFYFACCMCICHRSKKTMAVVPSVATKYMVADQQPF